MSWSFLSLALMISTAIITSAEKNQTIISAENNRTIISAENNRTTISAENNQTITSAENNQTITSAENNQTLALNETIMELQDEIAKVISENLKLKAEIESVDGQIGKRLETANEVKGRARGADKLKSLTFQASRYKIELENVKKAHKYMEELSKRAHLSLQLAKEQVRTLKERRKKGFEELCFILDEQEMKRRGQIRRRPSRRRVRGRRNSHSQFSLRSLSLDDTDSISSLIGTIDVAKSELLTSEVENTRLNNVLTRKKDLLKNNQTRSEAKGQSKARSGSESAVSKLEKEVAEYMKLNTAYRNVMEEIKQKLDSYKKEWREQQRHLKTTFKRARACYKRNDIKINSAFRERRGYKRYPSKMRKYILY